LLQKFKCVWGLRISFWLGTFGTLVVLVVLFPMPYLDDKGPVNLRSCDKGAELRLAWSETYTRISTTPPNTGIPDRGHDCGRMPG
jgi:hypothetical protein